jgi:hypothetical protein
LEALIPATLFQGGHGAFNGTLNNARKGTPRLGVLIRSLVSPEECHEIIQENTGNTQPNPDLFLL